MELTNLCMGCMEEKGEVESCPYCGWIEGTPVASPLHIAMRTLLSEKYLLGRVLGQGGFGITYLAWDLYLERKLAIKEFFPRELVFRDPVTETVSIYQGTQAEQYNYGLSKFLDEAKNLARFEGHPNIVSVRDYFEANDTAYMVMSYLEGLTLADFLDQRVAGMSFDEAIKVIMPVLDALRYLHDGGLLHRDISPDNIMITVNKRVMLLDFGAARHALGEKGSKYSVIVKPGYAPEEQYRSNGIQGPWTDIYAVAATLYRAVTNRMPPESLDRLNDDLLIPPNQLGITITAEQEAALLKAMEVRAADRYQSIADFQDALMPLSRTITTEEEDRSKHSRDKTDYQVQRQPYYYPDSPVAVDSVSVQTAYTSTVNKKTGASGIKIRIGRAQDNDLIISESMVSRYHASIENRAGSWVLSDLGSTHGTQINGKPVEGEVTLSPGTVIQLSNYLINFNNNQLIDVNGNILLDLDNIHLKNDSNYYSQQVNQNQDNKKIYPGLGKLYMLAGAAILGIFIIVYIVILLFD